MATVRRYTRHEILVSLMTSKICKLSNTEGGDLKVADYAKLGDIIYILSKGELASDDHLNPVGLPLAFGDTPYDQIDLALLWLSLAKLRLAGLFCEAGLSLAYKYYRFLPRYLASDRGPAKRYCLSRAELEFVRAYKPVSVEGSSRIYLSQATVGLLGYWTNVKASKEKEVDSITQLTNEVVELLGT